MGVGSRYHVKLETRAVEDMEVYLDTLPPQAPAFTARPRSAAQPPSHMRLRVIEGETVWAVFDVENAQDLERHLAQLTATWAAKRPEVHLWYGNAWWNLSDDLAQYAAWGIGLGRPTDTEARRFAGAPLSRPDWLYDAARQMQRLLDAALGAERPRPPRA